MRRVLLAGVALAALSLSPAVFAQERSPADENLRNQRNPTQTQTQQERGQSQDRKERAQQENRGATQSGHETGQDRAQQQRDQRDQRGTAQTQDRKEPTQDRAQQQQQQRDQRDQRGTAQTQDRNQPAQQDRAQQQQQQRDQRGTAQTQDRNQQQQDRTQTQSDRQGGARDQNQQQSRDTNRSTSGGNVDVTGSIRVDQQKASRVHEELLSRGERSNVNISVSVGERLPDRIRLRPLPSRIISISPEFRGYNYVIVHDEIYIVEPRTKKVVTIIRGGGGGSVMHRTTLRLEPPQRTRIRREIRMDGMRRFNIDVRPGMVVPQDVVLQPLPQMIVEEIPEVREYRFFVDRDDIVLVDPDSREVVEILR